MARLPTTPCHFVSVSVDEADASHYDVLNMYVRVHKCVLWMSCSVSHNMKCGSWQGIVDGKWWVSMLTLSIPINQNSLFKSTGWELHFPHPCSALSIEVLYHHPQHLFPDFVKAKWQKESNNVSVVKIENEESFMLMDRSFFVHSIQYKWEQNKTQLNLFCLEISFS